MTQQDNECAPAAETLAGRCAAILRQRPVWSVSLGLVLLALAAYQLHGAARTEVPAATLVRVRPFVSATIHVLAPFAGVAKGRYELRSEASIATLRRDVQAARVMTESPVNKFEVAVRFVLQHEAGDATEWWIGSDDGHTVLIVDGTYAILESALANYCNEATRVPD